jgi:hypothetical protein
MVRDEDNKRYSFFLPRNEFKNKKKIVTLFHLTQRYENVYYVKIHWKYRKKKASGI